MKQVDKSTYLFSSYMGKPRWLSLWHQLDEVLRLAPAHVLEIGPGPGTFSTLARSFGLQVQTLDPDPELQPDYVGSAVSLPLPDGHFDLVCAFQVLEHLPYDDALRAFAEMARVARRHVVISLPDARPLWHYRFHIPRIGPRDLLLARPVLSPPVHQFEGEHHWEINKRGYSLSRIQSDFGRFCQLERTFRVPENTYHRFMVFSTRSGTPSGIPSGG